MSIFNTAKKLEGYDEALQFNAYRDKIRRIIEDDRELTQFTPDYQELEQQKSHPLFIHDDMAQLQPYHDMVKEGSLSGFFPFHYGYTAKSFTYLVKNLGQRSIPIALDLRDTTNLPLCQSSTARIRGELYMVRPRTFYSLDNHRQNGVQFQRVQVTVNIPYKKIKRHTTTDSKGRSFIEYSGSDKDELVSHTAWMYVGREEYWKDQLEAESGFFNFNPVDIIEVDRIWLRRYYQYSKVR